MTKKFPVESCQEIQTGEDYLWWHEQNKRRYRVTKGYKHASLRDNQEF